MKYTITVKDTSKQPGPSPELKPVDSRTNPSFLLFDEAPPWVPDQDGQSHQPIQLCMAEKRGSDGRLKICYEHGPHEVHRFRDLFGEGDGEIEEQPIRCGEMGTDRSAELTGFKESILICDNEVIKLDDDIPPFQELLRMGFSGNDGPSSVESSVVLSDDAYVPPDLRFSGPDEGEVPCAFLTGNAGAGKTHYVKSKMEADPQWGLLASTTGISAVNLNTVTINSLLGYYDTESLQDNWIKGRINRKLRQIAQDAQVLVVDEVSMMAGEQLDIIYNAIAEFNESLGGVDEEELDEFDTNSGRRTGKGGRRTAPLKLLVTGDACQLPPVKAKWFFEADCWPKFQVNTTRLTKIWRQSEPDFIAALNELRRGEGGNAVELLRKCGVEFAAHSLEDFDGTSIYAKNEQVDRANLAAQMKVKGSLIQVQTKRRGLQRGEWTKNIPQYQQFKVGSLVMVLANQYEFLTKRLVVANGDLGHIVDWDRESLVARVKLLRNEQEVSVGMITRENGSVGKQPPSLEELKRDKNWVKGVAANGVEWEPYRNEQGRWVKGEIEWLPMRLGYASTVHKCLVGSTMVYTRLGKVQLSMVKVGDHVLSSDGYRQVIGVVNSGMKRAFRIRTYHGYELIGSGDHPIYVNDSGESTRPIVSLSIGMKVRLSGFVTGGHDIRVVEYDHIKAIEDLGMETEMWDIEVEGAHNFYANGILSHNCQGISVDRCQIDLSAHFMGSPAMLYTAVSRCRSAGGLRLVGTRDLFVKRCKIDPKTIPFL